MIRSSLRRGLVCSGTRPLAQKRFAHAPATFNWQDPLDAASLWTEDEIAISETARAYCQERMLPRVLGIKDRTHTHCLKFSIC